MKVFLSGVVGLFMTGFATALPAKDCDAILAQGLRDTFQFSDASSFNSAVHSAICSNRSSRSDNSSSFGVNIPLTDISAMLGFSANNGSARSKVDEYCSEASDSVDRQAAVNWTRNVVNSRVVSAWENCQAKAGFSCYSQTLSETDFQITVAWSRTNVGAGTTAAQLVGGPTMSNATCPPASLAAGVSIPDDSSVSTICNFVTPEKPAYVVLNSSQGPATCMAVPPQRVPDPTDHLSQCLAGQELSCLGIFRDVTSALAACDAIDEASKPDAKNNLSDKERGKLAFRAYTKCGNLRTGAAATRALTDQMQAACFSRNVNSASCNNAKQSLKTSAERFQVNASELVMFDPEDPAAFLALPTGMPTFQ